MILLLALIADAWSTHYLLSKGGQEGNPFSAWVLERWGFWPWTWAKLATGVAVVILAPFWVEWAAAAFFAWLAWRNVRLAG